MLYCPYMLLSQRMTGVRDVLVEAWKASVAAIRMPEPEDGLGWVVVSADSL